MEATRTLDLDLDLDLDASRTRLLAGLRSPGLPAVAGVALALAALISLLYLAQTSGVAITGYDIQQLELERDQWQYRNEQLRLQIAEAKSLDRVEHEASQRLTMGPPNQVVFVRPAAPAERVEPAAPTGDLMGPLYSAISSALSPALAWLRGDL
jgi:hypothetical protein